MVTVCPSQSATRRTLFDVLVGCGLLLLKVSSLKLPVLWLLVSTWLNRLAKGMRGLGGVDDATLLETWRMVQGEREVFAVPRVALLRSIMLNHWYHHRGQLTVYLRELDVPIPSIYGPSADENPFA